MTAPESPRPDLDPNEALTEPTDDFTEAPDPDLYEPQPGDDSYVEPGRDYPTEG